MRVGYNFETSKAFSRKTEDLVRKPVVILVNEFTEESAKKFDESFAEASESGQTLVPILIDSYGGSVYALMSMIDTIQNSKLPVATVCKGKAMSCGAILLSMGVDGMRYAGPNATIMIHEVSTITWGKNQEIQADAQECQRLNKKIFNILSSNCGKNPEYFEDIYKKEKVRADWFLTASEAKQHNLVNHVRIPTLSVNLSVKYELV
jgi:ATP-dependent Clp protease protease subunit